MKNKDIYIAMNGIDDELIEKSEQYTNRKINWRMLGGIAAAIALFVGIDIIFAGIVKNTNYSYDVAGDGAADMNEAYIEADDNVSDIADVNETDTDTGNDNAGDGADMNETDSGTHNLYADVNTLIDNTGNHYDSLQSANITYCNYEMEYHMINAVSEEALYENTGEALFPADNMQNADTDGRHRTEGLELWYKLLGHDDISYIIRKDEDSVSLWKFSCFTCGEYPYNDVLRIIYGINSADDIDMIISKAGSMDNTDKGRELQKQIGTQKIKDRKSIEVFYDIISKMTCYGSNKWDMIDYGGFDADADGNNYGMLDAVRNSRYLTLKCSSGIDIDSLNYTSISGMFYEYYGIAYNRLEKTDKDTIDKILKINR